MAGTERFDAIVVGAGVAGLAAARELSGAGSNVCVLEARQRLGGRVFTLHPPSVALPIELGAEFIHGEAHTTFSIVERAALLAYQLPDDHWWSRNGRLERVPDFWGKLEKLRARIPAGRDQSFADFLRSQRNLSPRLREMALGFVEGYHAAHADRISALALRASDSEQEEDGGGNKQFRIGSGYDALVEWLHAGLDPDRTVIRLGEPAQEIEWRAGHVAVRTGRGELQARCAVVTIPLGVWKSGVLRFTPPLRDKQRAIAKLESGHVVKIVFRFRERFWDPERNFVHVTGAVPTWWTSAPVRAPLLTAWAGGHAADALLAQGAEQMVETALQAMAETFATSRKTIDDLLAATYTHDWQADPFSRGAYSYAAVGGSGAHAALARPVKSTLYFAGEATNGEETGTVAGAIASGRRAAKEALRR